MPNWNTRPDRGDALAPITIVRTKPGPPNAMIVTSHAVLGVYTHYWKGRTKPCDGPACPACEAMMGARWYGYLAVWHPKSNAIGLLEITPSTTTALDAYEESHGTLRGAKVTTSRANRKINSRLILTIEEGTFSADKIPQPPNVRHQLCKLWEITDALPIGNTPKKICDIIEARKNGQPA
jgi:hypothetical protein